MIILFTLFIILRLCSSLSAFISLYFPLCPSAQPLLSLFPPLFPLCSPSIHLLLTLCLPSILCPSSADPLSTLCPPFVQPLPLASNHPLPILCLPSAYLLPLPLSLSTFIYLPISISIQKYQKGTKKSKNKTTKFNSAYLFCLPIYYFFIIICLITYFPTYQINNLFNYRLLSTYLHLVNFIHRR